MGSFLSIPNPGRKDEHLLTKLKPPRKSKSGHIWTDDLPTQENCYCVDNRKNVPYHSVMKFHEQDATNVKLENAESKKMNINLQHTSDIKSPVKDTTFRIREKDFPIDQSEKSRSSQFQTVDNYSNDVLKSKRLLEETGFHFLIPQLVYAFNQLQAEASRSSYHKDEIMNYYEELTKQSNKFAFVVTGIIGKDKSRASLLLFERLKNLNEATPFAVRNIRELESIQVLPDIKMTILVDGLFEQITSLATLKETVSSLDNFFKLLNTWSENNTIIISMEKEVLNFLKISSAAEDFLQKSFVIDLTDKVEKNMKEIFTHINDMDEKCFSCLSSVLLNPGLSFQCSAASRIHHSDLFRNDFMIPQKIAESFVGIYLEKEDSCYYVNDENIRKVLCQVHLKRNPEVFLEICPLRYLSYIMDHDDVCITKDTFYGTLLLRFFNEIKMHPSHSLFEEFARLLEMKNFDEHIFSFDAVKANIAQIPSTIKAHLANQLAVSGKDEFSSLIQMLVKDLNLTAKNVSKMSYDDISKLSDENIAHSRSTFTSIACEFDMTRYEWGQKAENIYPDCLSNQVLERLVKSVHMSDTLMAKILIRAVEENFCCQFSVGSEYVWTGYRFQKQRVTCNEYVIIVRMEGFKCTAKEVLPLKYCGLEVLVKGISEVDGESRAIMEDEAKFNLDKNLVIHDWVINSLLRSHSNITGITTSSVLSRNYKPGKPPNIEPVSCIVISCHTKGIIPMGEKPFPTNINGYPVDVRESCAAISAIRHPQIGDSIKSSTAEMGKGTLGGFVFVGNKIYYLTAAHVLVLKIHLNEHLFKNAKTLDVKILRKISNEWNECGKLERGYFGEIRLQRNFTVDAVLVNVDSDNHKPKHPFLPQDNATDAGFIEGSKPFFSGKIKDVSNLDKPLNIVKYGQTTLWTKGRLTSINAMRTIKINQSGNRYFMRHYFGQMVIKSDHGKFADLGDSGSLVFIVSDYNDPELECIGLLNAVDQASWEVYATPIRAVLESLRLDENAFKKFDPPFTLTYLNMITERLDLHTEILFNIQENTRQQAS